VAGVIVVDASVLVAHLDAGDAHHRRATELLLEVGESPLAASPITVAEVLVRPARADRLDDARAAIRALSVHEVPLATDAAERLAALRARTGLKMPDCCVLLAAEDAAARAVLTFDLELEGAAALLGFDGRSLLGPAETRSAAAHIRALALRGAESVVEQAGPEADLRRRLAESHGLTPATVDPRSLPPPAGCVDPDDPTPASDALRWVRGKA
jgi:predicted nucleic acid-binding protein